MPIIGLNLGKSSFRAVELEKKHDGIYLNKFGYFENNRLNLDSDSKEDQAAFSDALKHFIEETGFSTPEVVVGLDESSVFMRIISVPNMNDNELKSSIRFEAEQYIPIPINEVNISYQKLEADFSDKNKIKLQVVAARKNVLERYVGILRKARLIPKAIEPETIALGRVLGDSPASPVGTVVLEMGFGGTLISIVYGGFVRFSRSVPIGGETLTKALQQGLGLDILQAEEYKKAYGLDDSRGDSKVYDILRPLIDNVIIELNRALLFFSNHNPSANIKRIILTGGTALMPGLLLYVAGKMNYEVELANPVRNIKFNPKLEGQKQILIDQGPIYSTAFGLALRDLV